MVVLAGLLVLFYFSLLGHMEQLKGQIASYVSFSAPLWPLVVGIEHGPSGFRGGRWPVTLAFFSLRNLFV